MTCSKVPFSRSFIVPTAWVEETESRPPGRGVPSRSAVIQQLTQPGPRVSARSLERTTGLASLPRTLRVRRTEASLDNVPNRFVAFALRRWRDVTAQIGDALKGATSQAAPVQRGLREVEALLDRIDAVLSQEPFTRGRSADQLPGCETECFRRGKGTARSIVLGCSSRRPPSWPGRGARPSSVGQRGSVATLYEYWVYLTLAREVSELCGSPLDFSELLEVSDNGVNLGLRRGARRVLTGGIERLGRRLTIEVWFNRSFSSSSKPAESWTETMRPDISLHIRPAAPDPSFFYGDVWLSLRREVQGRERAPQWSGFQRRRRGGSGDDWEGHERDGTWPARRPPSYARVSGRDCALVWRLRCLPLDVQWRHAGSTRRFCLDSEPSRLSHRPRGMPIVWGPSAHSSTKSSTTWPSRPAVTSVRSIGSPETYSTDGVAAAASRVRAATFLDQPPADTMVHAGLVHSPAHARSIHRHLLYDLESETRGRDLYSTPAGRATGYWFSSALELRHVRSGLWLVDFGYWKVARPRSLRVGRAPTGIVWV